MKDNCSLTNEELVEKCRSWIDNLIRSGGKCWTLNIPARYNEDPDMLFTELMDRFEKNDGLNNYKLAEDFKRVEKENILLRTEVAGFKERLKPEF